MAKGMTRIRLQELFTLEENMKGTCYYCYLLLMDLCKPEPFSCPYLAGSRPVCSWKHLRREPPQCEKWDGSSRWL